MTHPARDDWTNVPEERGSYVRWLRWGYLATAIVLTAGVLIRIYIAGMPVFVGPARWSAHVTFGTNLPAFLVLLIVVAFLGRLPNLHRGLPVVLFGLFLVRFSTAHRFGSVVGAIHPVTAVLIFWVSTITVRQAWRSVGLP